MCNKYEASYEYSTVLQSDRSDRLSRYKLVYTKTTNSMIRKSFRIFGMRCFPGKSQSSDDVKQLFWMKYDKIHFQRYTST